MASVDEQSGVVNLAGRVVSQAQSADLRERIKNLAGLREINDAFQLVPRPFCDVLDFLEPFQQENMMTTLNKQGSPSVYYEGEDLVIDVTTPTKFPSDESDYYATDGMVGHLYPNLMEGAQEFKPNSVYTGRETDRPQRTPWKMGPPFGVDLITVIASKFLDPTV